MNLVAFADRLIDFNAEIVASFDALNVVAVHLQRTDFLAKVGFVALKVDLIALFQHSAFGKVDHGHAQVVVVMNYFA